MGKTDHPIDIEVIWKAVQKQASEEEIKQLQEWLGEDESHRRYFRDAEEFLRNGSSLPHTPFEIDQAWKQTEEKAKRRKLIGQFRSVAVAGIAALLLIALLFYYNNQTRNQLHYAGYSGLIAPGTEKASLIFDDGRTFNLSDKLDFFMEERGTAIRNTRDKLEYTDFGKRTAEPVYNTLSVPRGGEFSVKLADGTRIWMNAESMLRFPVRFESGERKVELTGEAYFEVATDAQRPFRVISGGQQLEVLGTSFNISCYEEDPVIFTTLVKGKVALSLTAHPEITQLLSPNEQAYYARGIDKISKRPVDVSQYTAWKEGRFIFDDELLSNIMKKLSKWYDVDIVFASEKAKQSRFTGNLQRYDNFEEILNKIEKTNEVKFYIDGRQITIE